MVKLKDYLLATGCLVILTGVLALSNETRAQQPPKFIPAAPCGRSPVPQRFVVSQDSIEVCDNATGLVWQREPFNQDLHWSDAIILCQSLGDGYSLPEAKELLSLVDYQQISPALPPDHPFVNVQNAAYWSATAYAGGNQTDKWYINIDDGFVNRDFQASGNAVWCVRDGSAGGFRG